MQQKQVYDRRTTQDKSAKAVKLTSSVAGTALCSNSTTKHDGDGDVIPEQGDIVALVKEHSTRAAPQILLGKVLRVSLREQELLLAHLQEVEESKYQLTVGQNTWTESFDAIVFPVDVVYDNIAGVYTLRSSHLEIHKIVKKD